MIFPLFLSTLENLSVNPIHSHRNSIVASQLTCLMLHCSGHFLQTFCSVSHLLYLYKFLPCSFFRTRILTFLWQKNFSTFFNSPYHPFCRPYHFNHSQGFFQKTQGLHLFFKFWPDMISSLKEFRSWHKNLYW